MKNDLHFLKQIISWIHVLALGGSTYLVLLGPNCGSWWTQVVDPGIPKWWILVDQSAGNWLVLLDSSGESWWILIDPSSECW